LGYETAADQDHGDEGFGFGFDEDHESLIGCSLENVYGYSSRHTETEENRPVSTSHFLAFERRRRPTEGSDR
jgi:hypothetical protein